MLDGKTYRCEMPFATIWLDRKDYQRGRPKHIIVRLTSIHDKIDIEDITNTAFDGGGKIFAYEDTSKGFPHKLIMNYVIGTNDDETAALLRLSL